MAETEEEEEEEQQQQQQQQENELPYNFNDFAVIQFLSFIEDPHILTIGTLS